MKHGKQNKLKTLESLKTQAKEVKVTCFDPAIVLIPIPISTYLPVTDVRRHHPGSLLLEVRKIQPILPPPIQCLILKLQGPINVSIAGCNSAAETASTGIK